MKGFVSDCSASQNNKLYMINLGVAKRQNGNNERGKCSNSFTFLFADLLTCTLALLQSISSGKFQTQFLCLLDDRNYYKTLFKLLL
jgi:hypothetical protein